jgi:hypothetical protein
MTSPVKARLEALLTARNIEFYRLDNVAMYKLLEQEGLMHCKTVIKDRTAIRNFDDFGVHLLINPKGNGSKHRVFVRCDCNKMVPYGRLHQHKCK